MKFDLAIYLHKKQLRPLKTYISLKMCDKRYMMCHYASLLNVSALKQINYLQVERKTIY